MDDDEFNIDLSQFELRPNPNQSSLSSYHDGYSNQLPGDYYDDGYDDGWLPQSTSGKRLPLPSKWSPPPNRPPLPQTPPVSRQRTPSPSDSVSDRMTQMMLAPHSPSFSRRSPAEPSAFHNEPRTRPRSPPPQQHQRSLVNRDRRPPSPSNSVSDRLTSIMLAPPDSPPQQRYRDPPQHHVDPRQIQRSPLPVKSRNEPRPRHHSPVPTQYRTEPRRHSPPPRNHQMGPRRRSPSPRPRHHTPVSTQYRTEPRRRSSSPRNHQMEPRRRSPSPRRHQSYHQQRTDPPRQAYQHDRISRGYESDMPAFKTAPRPPTPPRRQMPRHPQHHSPEEMANKHDPHGVTQQNASRNGINKSHDRRMQHSGYSIESSSDDLTLQRHQERRKQPQTRKKRQSHPNPNSSPSREPGRNEDKQGRQQKRSNVPIPPPLPNQGPQSNTMHKSSMKDPKQQELNKHTPEHTSPGRLRTQSSYDHPGRVKGREKLGEMPDTPLPDYEDVPECSVYIPRPDY